MTQVRPNNIRPLPHDVSCLDCGLHHLRPEFCPAHDPVAWAEGQPVRRIGLLKLSKLPAEPDPKLWRKPVPLTLPDRLRRV